MQTHNLGYPRIGSRRELKKATELYWAGKLTPQQLLQTGADIRKANWTLQKEAGIDLIPCNDFSFYDQVLDTCLMTGAIPERFHAWMETQPSFLDLLFAMARGYQKDGFDITAMEMTKWFDTNYHYLVPEFTANQQFSFNSRKVVNEFVEAKRIGINAKPVLLGPLSFLLLGKEKTDGFHRLELIDRLLPVYIEVLRELEKAGAYYVQLDEPCLAGDLSETALKAFRYIYREIQLSVPDLRIILAGYFDCYGDNLSVVLEAPVAVLHLDLVRCPAQLEDILSTSFVRTRQILSLGVVDGRNIWKNDFSSSLQLIGRAVDAIGKDRVWIAPSCSLLHVPCDLEEETNEDVLSPVIKNWLAFARQKIGEVVALARLAEGDNDSIRLLTENKLANEERRHSDLIHQANVKQRINEVSAEDEQRSTSFSIRRRLQQERLNLPAFPTTTIGSFPQTATLRQWRAEWKKGQLSTPDYEQRLREETEKTIRWQENAGLDVLVHGEYERNDMVEYFGEQLAGFVFTQNGWVQSYGTRCVKPPVIYGDVSRPSAMTVRWASFAQSLTSRPVKGMLTGPVTILQWSFVRNDQPRSVTCRQIALAIRDEVHDLEKAGIAVIQVDEPALREGLPLRKKDHANYLEWAVAAFRLSVGGVKDTTQIHTHMCYAEFNDIISSIAAMDADVITIECSRSDMELLEAFSKFSYPNDLGPGVYDIHAPRVPSAEEMIQRMRKACAVVPVSQLWVNPDCGLKTRGWEETSAALLQMTNAARQLREEFA